MKIKTFLLAIMLLIRGVVFAAEDYFDCIRQVENWLKTKYSNGSYAYKAGNDELIKILNSSKSKEEKISELKKTFPRAFQKEENPLIVRPPLNCSIHSLYTPCEISSSKKFTEQDKKIISVLNRENDADENIEEDDNTKRGNRNFGIRGGFNPLKEICDVKIFGGYDYEQFIVNKRKKLLSSTKQNMFSREHKRIYEMISNQEIKTLHLVFAVTMNNNTDKVMTCALDLDKSYIPVSWEDKKINVQLDKNRHPANFELKISPLGSKTIFFRTNLDTTLAKTLVDFMRNDVPSIDIQEGNLEVLLPGTDVNAITPPPEYIETRSVKLEFSEYHAEWNIRRFRASDSQKVLLRDALDAIDKDFLKMGKRHIFQMDDKKTLTSVLGIPFKGFSPKDIEKRFMLFLQSGEKIYSDVDSNLLDQPLDNVILWIIDLDNMDFYINKPEILRNAIFSRIKTLDKQNGCAMWRFRMGECYAFGVGIQQDDKKAMNWWCKAAAQGYAPAQNKVCDIFTAGINLKSDTFSQSDIEHNNMATLKTAFNSRRHQIEKTKRKLDELSDKYSGNNHINAECEKFKNYLDSMDKASFDCPEHKSKTWMDKCSVCGHKIWKGRVGGMFGIWRVCPNCRGAVWITRQEKCPNCGEMEKSKIPASQLIER